MRIQDDIFESYLNCKHKAYLKIIGKAEVPNSFQNFDERSLCKRKEAYYDELSSKQNVRYLDEDSNLTLAELQVGYDYILNATMVNSYYSIHLDVLKRVTKESSLGSFSYVPISVLTHNRILKNDRLLLAFKALPLSVLQNRAPTHGIIVYNGSFRTRRVLLSALKSQLRDEISSLNKLLNKDEPPYIVLNSHCDICGFHVYCLRVAKEEDNLSLIRTLRPKEIIKLRNKGISTVNQFSYTFRLRRKKKGSKKQVHRHFSSLKALAIREKKIYIYQCPDIDKGKGRIFLDVEGLPYKNQYYLIGLIIDNGDILKKFSIWINDESEADEKLHRFIEILYQYSTFTLYYYGSYEMKFFKYLLRHYHDSLNEAVKDQFSNSINVLQCIYAQVYLPTYSNGLKEVANYLNYYWTESEPSGLKSIYWRREWEINHTKELKKKLILYNYEDCIALRTLVHFLISLNQDNRGRNESDSLLGTKADYSHFNVSDNFDQIIKDTYKGHSFMKNAFVLKDFDYINKCAYIDYQLSKLHITRKKKSKRPKRYGYRRSETKNRVNTTIKCRRSYKCIFCESRSLYQFSTFASKTCVDLKFFRGGIKKWVVQYKAKYQRCESCGKNFFPKRYRKIGTKLGHNLVSWVAYQNVVNHLSFGKIERTLADCFSISVGTVGNTNVSRLKKMAADLYRPTYDRIGSQIRRGKIIFADETQIRTRGETGYVWVLRNIEEVYYLFTERRKADIVREHLHRFTGILITDFFTGYDSIECRKQKCLIHLMRDINEDLFNNQLDKEYKEMAHLFTSLLRKIINTVDKHGLKKRFLRKHNRDVDRFYSWIQRPFDSEICIKLSKRLIKNRIELFTFINYDDVPWNNNLAENAFRHFAEYRQRYNGRVSIDGIKRHLMLLSIYETCINRNVNFLRFLLSKERHIETYKKKYTLSGNRRKAVRKST